MIRLMRVHVCRYCCINYSLAISISLRKSVFFLMISYLSWNSHGCQPHDEHARVITACKATQVDACRLLSTNYSPGHRRVNRPTELSAVPLNRLCCSLQLGLNVDEEAGRVQGPFPLCRPDRPLDSSATRQRASALQPLFRSSGRSHPGPWENKGVRLHLFSVSVPQGIKGEDISSRPAWLGPTHLRRPFLPRSLQALFTHPADMACGTVVA